MVLAGSVGTIIDYYDFFIAATAASLIWPSVFFAGLPAAEVAFLSLFSFAALYLVRPLGAYFFGHLGDRLGRRDVLVLTLALTFVGVAGIAVLPPLGLTSVVLLILLRMIQGFGLGGEFGGVASWISEFAVQSRHRSFWTGWIAVSINLGVLLASGVFALAAGSMPRSALLAYGWRIPFVIGAVVLVAGGVIRWRLAESPLFEKLRGESKVMARPAESVLRERWKTIVLLTGSFVFVTGTMGMLLQGPYFLTLVTSGHTIGIASATEILTLASAAAVFSSLLGMTLGDIVGRKLTMVAFSAAGLVMLIPFYFSVETFDWATIALGATVFSFVATAGIGAQPALFAEQFPTRYRYSGAGMPYQLAGFIAGMLIGVVEPAIISAAGGVREAALPLFIVGGGVIAVGVVSQLFLRETKGISLTYEDQGNMPPGPGLPGSLRADGSPSHPKERTRLG